MGKILISNIGNRNLKVDGKFIMKIFDSDDNGSFRDRTRTILNQLKDNSFTSTLEPAIVNEVIELEKEELDKVILISSDMPESMRNDQDTIFEGEILCKILKLKYPKIEFVNVPITASVFVHDELFRQYHRILRELKKTNIQNHIVYCDAGGTSQQKFAMKISLEYLFESDEITVYYVAQEQKGVSKLLAGESYEYRKIIDMEHAIRAIHSSAYQLSISILKTYEINEKKFPFSLITFLDLRSRLFFDDAKALAKSLANCKLVPDFVKEYSKMISVGEYDQWEDVLSDKQYFQLCETLLLSQWKYSFGLTEQAIHFFSMFIENYICFTIRSKYGYKFDEFYESAFDKLKNDINSGIISLPDYIEIDRRGLPLLIGLAEQIEHNGHKRMISNLKQLNGLTSSDKKGIDSIRNSYAHKGKGVKRDVFEITPLYNRMAECYKIFGIDFKRNFYEEMHDEVCDLIRNN